MQTDTALPTRPVGEPVLLGETLPALIDDLRDAGPGGHDRPGPIPVGLADLDLLLGGGLRPGTLTVVAARPSAGASTLLTDMCRSAAIACGVPALLVSYQSPRRDIELRILAAEARVTLYTMRSGTVHDAGWTSLAQARPRLAGSPLRVAAPVDWPTPTLAAQVEHACAEHGVRLVAVDDLNHMCPLTRGDFREREVTEAAYTLRDLATRLGIAVVAAAQLDRGPQPRTDRRPNLGTDLRDSDAVAAAADTVIMLHREDAYEQESPRAGEADLIVAKHRGGPTGTVTVAFQGHYGRFIDMPPHP
ncbi:DnaB-like helicase C-terminal domain-containing protein [Planomonospora venezuelensis]|uniref:Replicative DNA helicase n=1 Tax=Planomonospora venezuelensis TaxID=1999 RepID=A0A841CY73_PLAVE|nr:DnaB-like helicase C-terminal domain-containing protein [Planomonospora venezuelensis]MBB5960937.1 replicative DNA helicase [Planomonospora venezuelensis]